MYATAIQNGIAIFGFSQKYTGCLTGVVITVVNPNLSFGFLKIF